MEPKIVAPNDTIVALASGPGLAAVAVIRAVRARHARRARGFVRRRAPSPACRLARHRTAAAAKLDRGLVLWFPAPASFTGEDMAELQLHGSRAVIRAVLDALLAAPRHAACRARRVRPPRVRERQARSHRGRGPGRSGQCRDRGAAASGAGAVGRLAAAALRRLARGAAAGAGAGRGRARFRR